MRGKYFWLRQKRVVPKSLSVHYWSSNKESYFARVDKLFKNNNIKEISPDFMVKMYDKILDREKIYWNLVIVANAMNVILFMNAARVTTEFSVLGVGLKDINSSKKILISVLSIISLFCSIMKVSISIGRSIIQRYFVLAHGARYAPITKALLAPLLGEAPDILDPLVDNVYPTKRTKALKIFIATIAMTYLFIIVVFHGASVAYIYLDIFNRPNYGPWIEIPIMALILAGGLTKIAISVFDSLPLPYADYTIVDLLTKAQEQGPAEHKAEQNRLLEIYARDRSFRKEVKRIRDAERAARDSEKATPAANGASSAGARPKVTTLGRSVLRNRARRRSYLTRPLELPSNDPRRTTVTER